ncbi:hypothetical protein DSO57_1003869 [Entomophthora muscae]|uniref:Uncharacterized protein n=1 Tax=Entomophthora muscae TaxID=34485 RepID=A0ACC2RNC2_9FUNG|nr:hypothetical protein DSO57_1003869 [Entomophthora muscae]
MNIRIHDIAPILAFVGYSCRETWHGLGKGASSGQQLDSVPSTLFEGYFKGADPQRVQLLSTLSCSVLIVVHHAVAPELPSLPANVSHNTQGALNGRPQDISNGMGQSKGSVELQAPPPN